MSQSCIYALVRSTHKIHLVRVNKTALVRLKIPVSFATISGEGGSTPLKKQTVLVPTSSDLVNTLLVS